MQSFLPTIVLRHYKENLKKCSLKGLEARADFQFFSYPKAELPPLEEYIMLDLEAPPLTSEDSKYGLLILDSIWRYIPKMKKFVEKGDVQPVKRSIPSHYRTAYPRRQDDCFDPTRGLASIEAIYISYLILGRPIEGLLEGYYWKDIFLEKNNL